MILREQHVVRRAKTAVKLVGDGIDEIDVRLTSSPKSLSEKGARTACKAAAYLDLVCGRNESFSSYAKWYENQKQQRGQRDATTPHCVLIRLARFHVGACND